MRVIYRIEQTPWWLTIWGFPPRRQWVVIHSTLGIHGEWEYLP